MCTLTLSLGVLLSGPFVENVSRTAALEPAAYTTVAGGAGFTMALFDATTLQDILKDEECIAIRFYNVMVSATASDGTVMAIGIDERGAERDGGLFASPYRIGVAGSQDKAVDKYSRAKAVDAFGYQAASGNGNFSTSFTRAEIEALLGVPGCGGLRVTPDEANGSVTMRLTAVGMIAGKITELPRGEGHEKVCGDPCPAFCGPSENYLQVK